MSNTKKINCPVCKSNRSEKYLVTNDYELTRCEECSLVWDASPTKDILAQYTKSYFVNDNPKGGYANYFEGMRVNRRTFTERLKKMEKKLGKKGKLLDVGCALGDCLLEAKHLGWKDAEGTEVSSYAHSFAKKRGLNVKRGPLEIKNHKKGTFDVISYQDVIEHIKDSVSEMKKAYKLLRPGGYVFFVTPDIGGWWHKLLGRYWYHYKKGEHVVYFSQESIRKALDEAGFEKIETAKTYHVLSVEYVLNRLKYYWPAFFEGLLKLTKNTSLRNMSFRAYTGEIEAWGQKEN